MVQWTAQSRLFGDKSPFSQQNLQGEGMDPDEETPLSSLMSMIVIVVHAEIKDLGVSLSSPFTCTALWARNIRNFAIRIQLANGGVGWGEAPTVSPMAVEEPLAMAKIAETCDFLKRSPNMSLGSLLEQIGRIMPGHAYASVRAGMEMALIDAVAYSIGMPLWKVFGGASNTIITNITIPMAGPFRSAQLASDYRGQGYDTLKVKVGENLIAAIHVLQAIRRAHPDCSFIIDANGRYTSAGAIQLLQELHEMKLTPVLFEQPVHRDDWEGLGRVTQFAKEKYGILVAADESCCDIADARKIVERKLANVINIKLAKLGVLGALEVIELARSSGLHLMMSAMVESRLSICFAGHLAAGLACFKFIDLDAPLHLTENPVVGGYEVSGPVYKFTNARGSGASLHCDDIQ
ncbi:hypothetical protein ACET3Z_011538 [Daucus carota]